MRMFRTSSICVLALAFLMIGPGLFPVVMFPSGTGAEVTRGSVLHVGEGQTYTSIQDAIDVASDGDEVYVHAGHYTGGIIIDVVGITVRGEDRNTTHIDGVKDKVTVRITANIVKFEDFYINGNGEDDVVRVEGDYVQVSDIIVFGSGNDPPDSGMVIQGCNGTFKRVTAYRNYHGFNINGSYNKLNKCIATNNKAYGFMIVSRSNVNVVDCLSLNNEVGFKSLDDSRTNYESCRAHYNNIGFDLFLSDLVVLSNCSSNFNDYCGLGQSHNLEYPIWMLNSTFIGNGGSGISLLPTKSVNITGCTIHSNDGKGIWIDEQDIGDEGDHGFFDNLIMNNTGLGVQLDVGECTSYFLRNDFIYNNPGGAQAIDNSSSIWHDGSSGNYWDDHTTPDIDSDGIVDSPYTVNGTSGSQDVYPLTSRATTLPIPVLSGSGMDVSPPRIVSPTPGAVSMMTDSYIVSNYTAIDPDTPQEDLIWDLTTNATLAMNGSLLGGFCPNGGTFWVNVTVSDGSRTDHHNFTLLVLDGPDLYDDPPQIRNLSQFNCSVGVNFELYFEIYDPDTSPENIHTRMITNAPWLNFSGTRLYGTPEEAGTFWVLINVTDELDDWSDGGENITFYVEEGPGSVDDPPEIIPPTDLVWYVNETVSVTLTARDTDTPQSELDWSIMTNASWLSISGTTLSGTPSGQGTFWITATVSDENSTDSENFTLVVRSRSVSENAAPVIMTADVLYAVVGYQYRVVYSAYDAEGDALLWTMDTDATFLRLNGSALTGAPDEGDIGNYSVSIEVTDGIESDETSFMLRVLEAPAAQDIFDIDLEFDEEYGLVTLSISDLWGAEYVDIVEIYWYIDGELVGNGTLISLELPEGDHNVTVMFRDSDGNWYTVTRTIEVGPGDDPVNAPLLWILLAVVVLTFIVVVLVSMTLVIMRKRRDIRPQEADEDWGISMDGPDIWGPRSQARWGPGKDDARVITGTISSEEDIGPLGRSTDIDVVRPATRRGTALEREYKSSMDIARSLKKGSRFSMNRGSMRRRLKQKYLEGGMDSELYEEMRTFIDENIEE